MATSLLISVTYSRDTLRSRCPVGRPDRRYVQPGAATAATAATAHILAMAGIVAPAGIPAAKGKVTLPSTKAPIASPCGGCGGCGGQGIPAQDLLEGFLLPRSLMNCLAAALSDARIGGGGCRMCKRSWQNAPR